ncbi:MAG: cytochrome P450 [Anaerolineales bacterium]|nr:cytochrome P450 [Anaerolineales bacterium]
MTRQPVRPQAEPPVAAGLPFVGSIWQLSQDSQQFMFDQYLKLGPIFRVKALGNVFKVLAGPELNTLMAKQPELFTAWDTWAPIVADFGGEKTLTMLDGPEHARMRKLMRKSFSRTTLMEHIPQTVEIVRSHLRRQPAGTPLSVAPLIQHITADELGLMSNNRLPAEHFADIVLWWNTLLEVYLAHQKSPKVLQREPYLSAKARVKAFAQSVLDERKATAANQADEDHFLDNLMAVSEAEPDFLSHDEALFLTLAAYFAGLDTVANVTAFMLYELLFRPELLAAARTEADAVFADGMPTPMEMRQMDVLHRTAMETLRLYPIAGVLPRTAAQDFEFEGYPIRKGEFFMCATAASHFSPDIYPNPHAFDIDRYCAPRNEHKQRGAFAPFGSGPHTCLGAGLAEVQIMLTVATILHSVEIAPGNPRYRLKKAYTPSLTPQGFTLQIGAWRENNQKE